MAARKSSSSEEFWKKSGSGEGLFCCSASSFVSSDVSVVCSVRAAPFTSSETTSLSVLLSSFVSCSADSLAGHGGSSSTSCCCASWSSSGCCSSSARTAALGSGSRGTSSSAAASSDSGTDALSLGTLSACSASVCAGSHAAVSGSGAGSWSAVLAASAGCGTGDAGGCGVGDVGVRLAKKSVSPSSWKSNMGAAGAKKGKSQERERKKGGLCAHSVSPRAFFLCFRDVSFRFWCMVFSFCEQRGVVGSAQHSRRVWVKSRAARRAISLPSHCMTVRFHSTGMAEQP